MAVADPPDDLPDRVLDALADADGALSTGAIQRRVARDGLDATRRVVTGVCEDLVEADRLVVIEGPPTRYRLAE